ncbi:MAG: response regulator [bacterium]
MSEEANQDIHVVVADDEAIVLSLVTDALEDEGFEVSGASDGHQGLELVRNRPTQLIITDIRMPHMDGIEMVKQAKEINPDVVVIFMTGYADLSSAKEAIKQGALEYILKPFELAEIRQAVRKAVEKIRKNQAEKGQDDNLERLSDLNQMLYAAGDRRSLATLSLKFALMHCGARRGAILFWDSQQSHYQMITIVDETTEERHLADEPMQSHLARVDVRAMAQPFHISRLEEHPLYDTNVGQDLAAYLTPAELRGTKCITNIPIVRADKIYALMMIGSELDSPTMGDADLRFVSITASQLALSLENIILLEEANEAYASLKALQDETIQLEKMATRGEMSAEIGHELNNFLGVVSGNLQLLDFNLKRGAFEQLDKYVVGIADNIEKVQKFTSNLMDLTPISSRKEVIRFDELLEEVIDYLKPQKRYSGVAITLHPIGDAIPFEADNVHIQQLLYNLFNNAADATCDQPRREIDVRVRPNPAESAFTVAISDSGVGIEPELLNKAFNEKFTTKKHGHGFGLLVCKRVIDSHGGQLHIDSTPGQGTTISVTFPMAAQETVPTATT